MYGKHISEYNHYEAPAVIGEHFLYKMLEYIYNKWMQDVDI